MSTESNRKGTDRKTKSNSRDTEREKNWGENRQTAAAV